MAFLRPFLALFALGMVGVLSLLPTLEPVARRLAATPGAPELPPRLLSLVLLVNPTLLLLLAVAVGTLLAPRLGLASHVAERARGRTRLAPALRAELPLAVPVGAFAAIVILALDAASRPLLGEAAGMLAQLEAEQPRTLRVTLAGVLYGGITEELMMRWGLMSLLVWGLWKPFRRGGGRPAAGVAWAAIVASAIVFGVGHLPVLAAQVPLMAPLVARTVLLNAVAGIAFGWLYWQRSLESAMIAHASAHIVFTLAAWMRLA